MDSHTQPNFDGDSAARDPESKLVLGPLLRYVDESSATIWVETTESGTVEALGHCTETFSILGRHYALVIIDGLECGSEVEYDIRVNGDVVWPAADSPYPPSVIRPIDSTTDVSILLGSCRAAAPHEPPFTLELATNHEGRGVDSLWAHGKRMTRQTTDQWPHLLLLVGDQIYADDSSPRAKDRIENLRSDGCDMPPEIVATYEEYCWLYQEAWSLPTERWLLSTVPSAMIFDDHDMIDDWNISAEWVSDIRQEPWWEQHAIEGLMSYWVYQHLGNLSPDAIREEKLLEALVAADDATELLRAWAMGSEQFTPIPGGYPFSHHRRVGNVDVVVIDCRNARVLESETRLMCGPEEWDWVRKVARSCTGHLILATSVPVFIADGLHDLQIWNERLCDGAWGKIGSRVGEKIRRALDLEDWSAFEQSYLEFLELVDELRSARTSCQSVVVASGDIHFSYAAQLPGNGDADALAAWQVVSSPIRNALIPPERGVMRSTLTAAGTKIGSVLRRSVRASDTRPHLEMAAGPFFANNMAELRYDGDGVTLSIEQSVPSDGQEGEEPELREVARLALYGASS